MFLFLKEMEMLKDFLAERMERMKLKIKEITLEKDDLIAHQNAEAEVIFFSSFLTNSA